MLVVDAGQTERPFESLPVTDVGVAKGGAHLIEQEALENRELFILVLEGELKLHVDGTSVLMGKGDGLDVTRVRAASWANHGRKHSKSLWASG